MGSASQAYGSPTDGYAPANAFAVASSRNVPKNSSFFKAFGNGPTNSRTVEPQQTEKQVHTRPNMAVPSYDPSFFDFDPPSGTESPLQNPSQLGTSGGISGWGTDMSLRPLSPPNSASPFSKDWNYEFQYMSNPPSGDAYNTIPPNHGTRAHYGQVTPPDEEHDDEFLLEHQLGGQQRGAEDSTPTKKRKRANGTHAKENGSPTRKRSRKNHARNAASAKLTDSSKPEDVRRSKFLERNRVAASKCRQKKKEWTQDLEDRGRNLQKDNGNLRILVDSLRQETLFLKGEMLRHSGCDSSQINDYLKSGAGVLQGSATETSMRHDSVSMGRTPESVDTTDLDGQSVVDEVGAQQSQTNVEIAGDENALEVLLTRSIHDDPRDERIGSQVDG